MKWWDLIKTKKAEEIGGWNWRTYLDVAEEETHDLFGLGGQCVSQASQPHIFRHIYACKCHYYHPTDLFRIIFPSFNFDLLGPWTRRTEGRRKNFDCVWNLQLREFRRARECIIRAVGVCARCPPLFINISGPYKIWVFLTFLNWAIALPHRTNCPFQKYSLR